MHREDYKIMLMNYDGDIIQEYESYIIPAAGDTILLDDDKSFLVNARHFSINHFKVVLLGDLEEENKSQP
jgi:hypothetical protein